MSTVDEAQDYGKKYGRTWTKEDLEAKVRKVEVLNFAKLRKHNVKDDIIENWIPITDHEMQVWMTGFHAAMDDLHRWIMGKYEDDDE